MVFFLFILFLILLRLSELFLSKRNEEWLINQGAVEYGRKDYPFIIALHVLFISSMIIEYLLRSSVSVNYLFLVLFLLLLILKLWTIASLGKYWNTKIFRVPGSIFIRKGPYKFLKHPNYIIVICEIAAIPLIFNLYITAIGFSVFNAVILSIRIKKENKVWQLPDVG